MSSANAAPVQSVSESPPSPPDDRSGSQRKEKLKRSKDGCFSCRGRKKRCSFTRPVCESCERLGLVCQWPVMGRDEKGRMVVVNRPPKRAKPNPAEGSRATEDAGGGSEHDGSQASGSHSGGNQWPPRSSSPPRGQKQASSSSAASAAAASASTILSALANGRPVAGMRMEDWALSLGQLGLVAHPPPAADSPLPLPPQNPGPRTAAQETDDLLEFLLPQYHRSVQAAQASTSGSAAAAGRGNPSIVPARATDAEAEAFLNAAMFPNTPQAFRDALGHAHHLPAAAFMPSANVDAGQTDGQGSSSALGPPETGPQGQSMLVPSPSATNNLSPWFEEALQGASPRTFAQTFNMVGFSPGPVQTPQNGLPHGVDLANFSASDWLVSTPRPEPGTSASRARSPLSGAEPLAGVLSQASPMTAALAGFDLSAFLEQQRNRGHSVDQPPPQPTLPLPVERREQQQQQHPLPQRRPGDSPLNPIVPPLQPAARKRTADEALGFQKAPQRAFDEHAVDTFDFDFDDLDDDDDDDDSYPSDDGDGEQGKVDGIISRQSLDGGPHDKGKDRMMTLHPSAGPSLSVRLPANLPAFIASQAPELIEYFLRELAPLVSVLTPDQKSVNALSKAVSAGAALRGRFEGGQAGVSTGTANGVERRAGNDLASCFLPMALESDSLLVGIVAWSAMHRSDAGQPWREIAEQMTDDASTRASKSFREWESNSLTIGSVEADREAEKLLGTLILLSEIEICRGSTENWYSPLLMAQKVLQRMGGSKGLSRLSWNGKWLMQNYVYHELTSSLLPLEGPVFDEETYKVVLDGGLNTFMGSTMPIFQILSDIARLSPSLPDVLSDSSTDDDPRKRIESLLNLSSKIALLETRLDACYPTSSAHENGSKTAPYHFSAFRMYGLMARLYLKQVVLHSNARSIANQTLVAQLLEAIKVVQPTPFESSLLFPIFIAGVDCVTPRDRDTIRALFEGLHSNCRIGNIQTAFQLLNEIWQRNEGGDRWVNWAALARELGWHVSFA